MCEVQPKHQQQKKPLNIKPPNKRYLLSFLPAVITGTIKDDVYDQQHPHPFLKTPELPSVLYSNNSTIRSIFILVDDAEKLKQKIKKRGEFRTEKSVLGTYKTHSNKGTWKQ